MHDGGGSWSKRGIGVMQCIEEAQHYDNSNVARGGHNHCPLCGRYCYRVAITLFVWFHRGADVESSWDIGYGHHHEVHLENIPSIRIHFRLRFGLGRL